MSMESPPTRKLRIHTQKDLDRIFSGGRGAASGPLHQLTRLTPEQRLTMKAVSAVLPFRVNSYVIDELIDWDRVPDDPIFQLTFPQQGMLAPEHFATMRDLVARGAPEAEVRRVARAIQHTLNPHPAGQRQLNVPHMDGEPVRGMQHKYRETVLFFPTQGQTCHAYCTYCFRWAQFVGLDELKFASREPELLHDYVAQHPEVTSVLLTGGDPMVMRTSVIRRFVEPLLEIEHVQSIRIGTKSPAYWPHRYVTDPDADDLLRLFEQVGASGKTLALMAHYSHVRELETPIAQQALARIRGTGAVVRTQAPLIRHVNDDARTWADMWRLQVRLGAVPYYMFVERDTGAKHYFEVPLARALRIYDAAYKQVSGLGRTARGPSMSATPGKVLVDGVADIGGEKVFALKFVQARNPEWVGRVFFARYDERATWLDQLRPALGAPEFFFEPELREMKRQAERVARGGGRRLPVVAEDPGIAAE